MPRAACVGPAIDEPPDPHLSGRTVGLVERAISHYERNGLASTVDHYTVEFQRQQGGRYLILLAGCADTPAELRHRQRLQDVEAQCTEWVAGELELSDRAQAMCAALGWDP